MARVRRRAPPAAVSRKSLAAHPAAGFAAGAGLSLPALAAQRCCDHGGAVAGAFGDIDEAEPISADIVDGQVDVVALLVPPHLFVPVVCGAVEFDADAVRFVPDVLAVGPAGDRPAGLAPGLGESVGTFDVTDVTALKREVGSLLRVSQRLGQPDAPAHPLPRVEGGAEHAGGDELLGQRPGDPAVRLVEGSRSRDKVQNRVLDPGARQRPWRKPLWQA